MRNKDWDTCACYSGEDLGDDLVFSTYIEITAKTKVKSLSLYTKIYAVQTFSGAGCSRWPPEVPFSLNKSTNLRISKKVFIQIFEAAFQLLKLMTYYSTTRRNMYKIIGSRGSEVSKPTCTASYLIQNNHHLKLSCKFCCNSKLCF